MEKGQADDDVQEGLSLDVEGGILDNDSCGGSAEGNNKSAVRAMERPRKEAVGTPRVKLTITSYSMRSDEFTTRW